MIYFIQNSVTLAVKIGTSRDPARRLSTLQCGTSDRLMLRGIIPGEGDREARLHGRFAHLRLGGEWFRGEPELIDAIDELTGAEAVGPGTVWDECERRGNCRYGLAGVRIGIPGQRDEATVRATRWDRNEKLLLVLEGGGEIHADQVELRSVWPRARTPQ